MKKEDFVKLGLTEEQAEKCATAYAEATKGFVPHYRFNEVNEAKKAAEATIAERDKQLEGLKKSAEMTDTLKAEIAKLQDDNKAEKEQYEAKISEIQKNNMIDMALVGAKAKNVKAVKALIDAQKISVDGENLIGLQEQLKSLTEDESTKFLFEQETAPTKPEMKGVTPPDGGGSPGAATDKPKTLAEAIAAKLSGNQE